MALEKYYQYAHKQYEASVLLLNNNAVNYEGAVCQLEDQSINLKPTALINQKIAIAEVTRSYLGLQKMRQMIERFINEKHLSIMQLAEKLGVSPCRLQKLDANYKRLAAEISMPLIKLYCKTKWV